MDLRDKIRGEIVCRQLAVKAATDAVKRAEREARKESRGVPRSEMERLQADVKFARAQLDSAHCSLEGVLRYPPVSK